MEVLKVKAHAEAAVLQGTVGLQDFLLVLSLAFQNCHHCLLSYLCVLLIPLFYLHNLSFLSARCASIAVFYFKMCF